MMLNHTTGTRSVNARGDDAERHPEHCCSEFCVPKCEPVEISNASSGSRLQGAIMPRTLSNVRSSWRLWTFVFSGCLSAVGSAQVRAPAAPETPAVNPAVLENLPAQP